MKEFIFFTFIFLAIQASAQNKEASSFYGELNLVEANFLGLHFYDNQFNPYSFKVGLGYKEYVKSTSIFFELGIAFSTIRLKTNQSFVEPYGTIIYKNKFSNFNASGHLGYQFSKLSLALGLGSYLNLKVNSKVIQKSESTTLSDEDKFHIVSSHDNFEMIGITSSLQIGYKLNPWVQLNLASKVSFIQGLNPLNAKGLRFLSILEYEIGIRRYLQ